MTKFFHKIEYRFLVIIVACITVIWLHPHNRDFVGQAQNADACEYVTTVKSTIQDMYWSHDGNSLLIRTPPLSEWLQVWDRRFGEGLDFISRLRVPLAWSQVGTQTAWDRDGNLVAIIEDSYQVTVYDTTGRNRQLYTLSELAGSIAWSSDSRYLASLNPRFRSENLLYLWDAETGQLIQTIEDVLDFAWSPTDNRIVVEIYRDTEQEDEQQEYLIIYDGATSEALTELIMPTGLRTPLLFPENLTWSPDGRLIIASATISAPTTTLLWDARTGELVTHNIPSLSPFDWQATALAGIDGETRQSVIFWDVEVDTELGRLDSPASPLRDLTRSPDGTYLAVIGAGNSIYICEPMLNR